MDLEEINNVKGVCYGEGFSEYFHCYIISYYSKFMQRLEGLNLSCMSQQIQVKNIYASSARNELVYGPSRYKTRENVSQRDLSK